MIPPERWKPSGGLGLEPNAMLAAMETKRSLALTAGPGAGKTEMLAQRADFLLRTGTTRFPRRILAISFKVDAAKNLKERVRIRCGSELASRLDSFTFHAFAKRIIDKFRPVLKGKNKLNRGYTIGDKRVHLHQITFKDMVPLAVEILETSAIARNSVRQTYSHVFLDEFQDCTTDQYRLIQAAFAGTGVVLTAVGDTKQRIMAWAGALEGIFETFAGEFDAVPLNLYQNFRSKPRLRRMQNAMVKVMDPGAAVDDSKIVGSEGSVEILNYADSQEEAEQLANRIASWIDDDGLDPSEIAVLVSKQINQYCDILQVELTKRGIPFRNDDSAQELSSEPIAALITDFLLVISGKRQPAAYGRLIGLVMFSAAGPDAEYLARARWSRLVERCRKSVLVDGGDLKAEGVLEKLTDDLLAHLGNKTLVGLSPDYENGTRLKDLIATTLDRLRSLLKEEDDCVTALSRFAGDGAVKVMTIHKSKGLEFDTVVVLGVVQETFWGNADAERSGFFVAISRAKRRLYMTVAAHRREPEGARYWRKSRNGHVEFLGYADEDGGS